MTRSPMDKLLDTLEWTALPTVPAGEGLYATHEGVLQIGDTSLKVYQLNNGQRVIEEHDFWQFFGIDIEAARTRGEGDGAL